MKSQHKGKAMGPRDSAIVVHTPAEGVEDAETEKPTQKGDLGRARGRCRRRRGFTFLLPAVSYAGMAGAGAGLGASFGHLAHGTSRGDAKDIGAMLEPGKAALIVIGVDKDAEQIERAATRAQRHVFKREVGDWDEAELDALAATCARARLTRHADHEPATGRLVCAARRDTDKAPQRVDLGERGTGTRGRGPARLGAQHPVESRQRAG